MYDSQEPGAGFFRAQVMAVEELYLSRHILWSLFMRDFRQQFQQRLLGYAWVILAPIMGVLSFLIMYSSGILNPGDNPMPYPVFVLFGGCIWALLPGSINAVSQGILNQADLVMRTNIPKMALVMSTMINFLYGAMVNFLVIMALCVAMKTPPGWWAAAYILMCLPMLAIGVGVGLALAVVGSIARDLSVVVNSVLTLFMFFTPVAYSQSQVKSPAVAFVMSINPVSYLVSVPRDLIFTGTTAHWGEYAASSAFAMVFLGGGVYFFYKIQSLVAERL